MTDLRAILQPETHIDLIRDVLLRERKMRAWVFRYHHDKRDTKVREIDDALASLRLLEERLIPSTRKEML